jgi:hypothetical protein
VLVSGGRKKQKLYECLPRNNCWPGKGQSGTLSRGSALQGGGHGTCVTRLTKKNNKKQIFEVLVRLTKERNKNLTIVIHK